MLFDRAPADPPAPTLPHAEKLAWIRLARTDTIGPVTFHKFIQRYGTAVKALEVLPDLALRGGRKKPLHIPPVQAAEREIESARRSGGQIITAAEMLYPLALSALEDAPPVLTVLGHAELLQKPCTGIVGARNASLNGRKFAETLARELGQQGQVITSGLARGIDTAAHTGSIETGTIAVVAGGADIIYPPENKGLYNALKDKGAIVAESPWGQKPFAQSFPKRNRIISGLSQGVVVVEATVRSGSLITARMAGEQGRDVYAVPGHPFDPRAAGPNTLIRDGATLVRSAADVLESLMSFQSIKPAGLRENDSFRFEYPALVDDDFDPPEDARELILSQMSFLPTGIDDIARSSGVPPRVLQTVLLELELAGKAKRLPGGKVVMLGEND